MILTAILIGVGVIVGATLLVKFWNEMTSWLKRAINTVKEICGMISYGVSVFVRKVGEGLKEISKHYIKKNNQWEEKIVSRTISENEVPNEIREKASYSYEVDVTEELENQLGI